jgi:hypothetical protein
MLKRECAGKAEQGETRRGGVCRVEKKGRQGCRKLRRVAVLSREGGSRALQVVGRKVGDPRECGVWL